MVNNVCKIISVSNQKGGVGKTTTAINLAASIAVGGGKVLLMDVDPQGNATTGVGIRLEDNSLTAYDLILNQSGFEEVVQKTSINNLEIIPSNIHLTGAEIELVTKEKREFALKTIVINLRNRYDFIIIDSPPSLGLLTLNALTAADTVLIPLQCEYYALEGLGHLLNTLKLVKKNLNTSLKLEGILFTMFDSRTSLSAQVIDEVRKHFKGKVLNTVIPRNVRLGEAPSHGQPVLFYDKASRGAVAYIDLAKEILKKWQEKH